MSLTTVHAAIARPPALVLLTALVLALAGSSPVWARTFRLADPALTAADMEQVQAANRALLAEGEVGATRRWENPDNDHRGSSRLLRLYDKDGASCAVVGIAYKLGGGQRQWVFHYCKQSDGVWKIAG